ncbi:MAG: carboxypeptidase regulatory-like domain-containing protein [Dermatophilaceae bacterium]
MTTDETRLADGPLDEHDAKILTLVRELHARTDPVPSGLTDRVKFELTLAALHAEIAELEHLSMAQVRDDAATFTTTDSVTFTSSTLSLMVTFGPPDGDSAADTIRVDGWVTSGRATVELRVGQVSLTTTADDNGRFVIEGVPHGSARFILRPESPDERPVITPSIEL